MVRRNFEASCTTQAKEEERERLEFCRRGWCDIVQERDHSLAWRKDVAICGITVQNAVPCSASVITTVRKTSRWQGHCTFMLRHQGNNPTLADTPCQETTQVPAGSPRPPVGLPSLWGQ